MEILGIEFKVEKLVLKRKSKLERRWKSWRERGFGFLGSREF